MTTTNAVTVFITAGEVTTTSPSPLTGEGRGGGGAQNSGLGALASRSGDTWSARACMTAAVARTLSTRIPGNRDSVRSTPAVIRDLYLLRIEPGTLLRLVKIPGLRKMATPLFSPGNAGRERLINREKR